MLSSEPSFLTTHISNVVDTSIYRLAKRCISKAVPPTLTNVHDFTHVSQRVIETGKTASCAVCHTFCTFAHNSSHGGAKHQSASATSICISHDDDVSATKKKPASTLFAFRGARQHRSFVRSGSNAANIVHTTNMLKTLHTSRRGSGVVVALRNGVHR